MGIVLEFAKSPVGVFDPGKITAGGFDLISMRKNLRAQMCRFDEAPTSLAGAALAARDRDAPSTYRNEGTRRPIVALLHAAAPTSEIQAQTWKARLRRRR